MRNSNLSVLSLLVFVLFLVSVLSVSVFAGEYFLKQTLFEGESISYDVDGYVYEVKLIADFDSHLKAQFEVNGEDTGFLDEDESEKLSDGAVIQIRSIMPQEAGDGKDLVQFNFFPGEHVAVEQVVVDVEESALLVVEEPVVEAPVKSEKKIDVAPARESKVDITRTKPNMNWWDSMVNWLKGLFS